MCNAKDGLRMLRDIFVLFLCKFYVFLNWWEVEVGVEVVEGVLEYERCFIGLESSFGGVLGFFLFVYLIENDLFICFFNNYWVRIMFKVFSVVEIRMNDIRLYL